MPLYESPAITLRYIRLGEADKLVTLYTRKFGKIKAVAKGAAKPKSRLGGRIEPFMLGKVIVFGKEKVSIHRLNSFDIVEPYLALRNDYKSIYRAFVASELIDSSQGDWDANPHLFDTLKETLKLLSESRKDRGELPVRIFELKYLSIIGLRPQVSNCIHCEGPLKGQLGFNAGKGGAVCGICMRTDHFASAVSVGAIKLIERSLKTDMSSADRLTAAPLIISEISKIVNQMIETHLHRKLRSEKLLHL